LFRESYHGSDHHSLAYPILIEEGDFYPTPRPVMRVATLKYAHLPDLTPGSLYPGSPVVGDPHMVMQASNNLQIADIFIGWLTSRGL
jgi:hypothetical protein